MALSTVHVATWNLEQATAESERGVAQAKQIAAVGAEVWILTEACSGSAPTSHKTALSAAMPGVKSGAHFAIIAAANLEPLDLPELPTGAAAVVHASTGDWLVIGICMPWRKNAPALPPDAAPGANTGPEEWHHVLGKLDEAINRLSSMNLPIVVAGDFNQTLVGFMVGSGEGRERLEKLQGLTAFTADAPSALAGCHSVDHIFGPSSTLPLNVFPSLADVAEHGPLSDHRGYSIVVGSVSESVA